MSPSLFASLFRRRGRFKAPSAAESSIDPERFSLLREFARKHRIPLGDGVILNEALTHKSYAYERNLQPRRHNEKLEFLGDSVLGLIICEHVYASFPEVTEGGLSKVKSVIVSAQVLSEKAEKMSLGRYLLMGRGEEKTGGRKRPSLLADALEAVIGAVYLTGGLEAAREFVLGFLRRDVDHVFHGKLEKDHKTLLQEFYQKTYKFAPRYRILRETGPDHNRVYEVACTADGKTLAVGTGRSKKEAEQAAAREAIRTLGITVSTPRDHRAD